MKRMLEILEGPGGALPSGLSIQTICHFSDLQVPGGALASSLSIKTICHFSDLPVPGSAPASSLSIKTICHFSDLPELKMLGYIEGERGVVVRVENTEEGRRISTSEVAHCLLQQLKNTGAYENYGYVVAVTEVVSIGRGDGSRPPYIVFPVTFRARTFLPQPGDVMIGTVYRVCRTGVFLACGPMTHIYLARQKMGDYSLLDGEEPFFLSGDQSRIEKDTVIRFKVLGARWQTQFGFPRHFEVIATILDPSLGPIQSAGDAMDLESLCPDDD